MEREDERLSTRDIASGTQDPDVERGDTALADPDESPAADTAAVPGDRAEDDVADERADEGAVAASEAPPGRGPTPEPVADAGDDDVADTRAQTGAASDPTPAAASAAADAGDRERTDSRADDAGTATRDADGEPGPLLDGADEFQTRWEEIQVRFVDEPRGAVEDADALVATVMQRLAEGFASERERLEAQWGRGEDISTEDLRVALQRYRSFFQRLLAT